ncbi:unnamed protein product [Gongylonema pulchrum]|uniref:TPT domain-containing protein n=1 Tax=Gongylonema pulchrum TaxID=637853 RepID=A0A183D1E7_9BILA|nr:unnamed protein product [Gongylonema pulchrum]
MLVCEVVAGKDLGFEAGFCSSVGMFSNGYKILSSFLLELTMSTFLCSVYLFTCSAGDDHSGAAAVAATRAVVTFVGYFSIGQSANLARTVGVCSSAYIFLSISDEWKLIYLPLLANTASAFISAVLYWFVIVTFFN